MNNITKIYMAIIAIGLAIFLINIFSILTIKAEEQNQKIEENNRIIEQFYNK